MIQLQDDQLIVQYPEVHWDAILRMDFQRTLRIPDDGHDYPLTPGLGRFPVQHVDDYDDLLPDTWRQQGGVFLPMYQSEALWINFSGSYPFAVKIAAGKVNAVTGETWRDDLADIHVHNQDYLVVPDQPWLDGFCIEAGFIRQFVATPLDGGGTVEEQVTGKAEYGGLQIVAYPLRRDLYLKMVKERERFKRDVAYVLPDMIHEDRALSMGLGTGGRMRQGLYRDRHGYDAWDQSVKSRCFVHIANSLQYQAITGRVPPGEPPTAKVYTDMGLPWFEYYDDARQSIKGSKLLSDIDTVPDQEVNKNSEAPLVKPGHVVDIKKKRTFGGTVIKEG
jgi:hypothetical protein